MHTVCALLCQAIVMCRLFIFPDLQHYFSGTLMGVIIRWIASMSVKPPWRIWVMKSDTNRLRKTDPKNRNRVHISNNYWTFQSSVHPIETWTRAGSNVKGAFRDWNIWILTECDCIGCCQCHITWLCGIGAAGSLGDGLATTGDKPLSKPTITQFPNARMLHFPRWKDN